MSVRRTMKVNLHLEPQWRYNSAFKKKKVDLLPRYVREHLQIWSFYFVQIRNIFEKKQTEQKTKKHSATV